MGFHLLLGKMTARPPLIAPVFLSNGGWGASKPQAPQGMNRFLRAAKATAGNSPMMETGPWSPPSISPLPNPSDSELHLITVIRVGKEASQVYRIPLSPSTTPDQGQAERHPRDLVNNQPLFTMAA